MPDVRCNITESLAVLSEYGTSSLQLNRVSWNDAPPKYDLRRWTTTPGGRILAGKGVTLSDDEAAALCSALCRRFNSAPAQQEGQGVS